MVHFTVVLSLEHAARLFVFSQYGSCSSRRWFALRAAKPAMEPLVSLPEIADRPQTSFHVAVSPAVTSGGHVGGGEGRQGGWNRYVFVVGANPLRQSVLARGRYREGQ